MTRAPFIIVGVVLAIGGALPVIAGPPVQPAAGKLLYRQCVACHGATGEGGATGPGLIGVVGRKAASDPDFAYSAALKRSGKTWTQAELSAFLLRPQASVPGTRMAYAGAGSPEKAAALAAYLATMR